MSREQQTKCPQCGSFQRPTPLTAFDAPLVTCGHSWHLGEPTPPATPRGSCAFGQHEWKGTNAEGSCICGELTLSRTPPATPQETALKPEQIYMAGWREGWEAAKVSTDRVPHVSEMVAAWERSEAKNLTVSLSPPPDVERLTQRPETGPMQFGDDWPGVFVRGDNAGGIVSTLMSVIDLVEKTQPMQAVPLRSIMRLFDSSDVRKKPEVQKAELVAGADPVPVCQWREIVAEVERATKKFPTWPTDPLHALAVLGEEFGELTKAVVQQTYEPHKNAPGELRKEAIQTAAMALRFVLSLDAYQPVPSVQHEQALVPVAREQ